LGLIFGQDKGSESLTARQKWALKGLSHIQRLLVGINAFLGKEEGGPEWWLHEPAVVGAFALGAMKNRKSSVVPVIPWIHIAPFSPETRVAFDVSREDVEAAKRGGRVDIFDSLAVNLLSSDALKDELTARKVFSKDVAGKDIEEALAAYLGVFYGKALESSRVEIFGRERISGALRAGLYDPLKLKTFFNAADLVVYLTDEKRWASLDGVRAVPLKVADLIQLQLLLIQLAGSNA
jgi:hypothetical protein